MCIESSLFGKAMLVSLISAMGSGLPMALSAKAFTIAGWCMIVAPSRENAQGA